MTAPGVIPVPKYRPFGAFRLLLAAVVVLNHGAWLAPDSVIARLFSETHAGSAAVLAFFALSGFILSEAASTFYRDRPLAFVTNRFLKIVPAFLAALALSIVVHWLLDRGDVLAGGLKFEGYQSLPPLWRTQNLLYNPASIVPFLMPDSVAGRIGEVYLFVRYIWAVNVEMLFYAFVAVFILVRTVRPLQMRRVLVVVGVLLYALCFIKTQWSGRVPYVFYSPLFVLGISLLNFRIGWHWASASAIGGLLSLLSAASLISGLPIGALLTQPALLTAGTLGGTALFAMFIAGLALLAYGNWNPIAKSLDRRLGDLSYALYLNQYSALVVFSATTPRDAYGVPMWMLLLVAATLVAALLQYAVEQPIAAVRMRVRGHALA